MRELLSLNISRDSYWQHAIAATFLMLSATVLTYFPAFSYFPEQSTASSDPLGQLAFLYSLLVVIGRLRNANRGILRGMFWAVALIIPLVNIFALLRLGHIKHPLDEDMSGKQRKRALIYTLIFSLLMLSAIALQAILLLGEYALSREVN